MRFIDADALTEHIQETYCATCDNRKGVKCKACEIGVVLDYIEDAPTVEERKHGHWIDYPHGSGAFCSCCKFKIRYKDKMRFRLCPNCGAEMDEVSKDE